jgi:3-methyladenine DNA glycosylase AlkD
MSTSDAESGGDPARLMARGAAVRLPPMPTTTKAPKKKPAKAPRARMTFAEAMRELEKAGSAQTRKTYGRHGVQSPMFGVSFATLKEMKKRIGVDHELAEALWKTGNFDAQNLAVKIVDPARMSPADLDRWVREGCAARICGGYSAMLASEGPHGEAKASQWLSSKNEREREAGWVLLGQLSQRDETLADAYFEKRIAEIERTLHSAPNLERYAMNMALIMIGCRNASLRKAATAAAKRIGKVEIDYGDTACQTADAQEYIAKTWARSTPKFATPAAAERARDVPRLRC